MILVLYCVERSIDDICEGMSDQDLHSCIDRLETLGLIKISFNSLDARDWTFGRLFVTHLGSNWLKDNKELLQAALDGTLLGEWAGDKFRLGKRRRLSPLVQPRSESPDIDL